jgi:hypothetical protein
MSQSKKVIISVLLLVSFFGGVLLGFVIKNGNIIEFNREIRISEVANFLLTIGLAFLIPFFIKKWIDDGRFIKGVLVDEVKNLISTLSQIKIIITNCNQNNKITKDQKYEINAIFHEAELNIDSLNTQLTISYSNHSKTLHLEISKVFNKYKDFLTGGDFMNKNFDKISSDFLREHNTEYSKLTTYLKTIIHEVHKF